MHVGPSPGSFSQTHRVPLAPQAKTESAELEEVSDVTAMLLSAHPYTGLASVESDFLGTRAATTRATASLQDTEPPQWSRLRMTYSFEYFIMKQYGKVLL